MTSRKIFIALAISAILGGCVVAPGGRPYDGGPVMIAPPAPRIEYPAAPPIAGQIWIGGFWTWTGQRHEWVPGHWSAPRPGYIWVPHRWEQRGDHWRQHEGHWEEQHRHGEHWDQREWR